MIKIDQTPCVKNNNIMAQKCQSDDTKNACTIDITNNVHHVPCTSNNDVCASKYDIHDPCASNYDIITLSKNTHQEPGIELIPMSNQQNVTALNQPARTHKLLITETSNMEELLDNAMKMEQLLDSTSTNTFQAVNQDNMHGNNDEYQSEDDDNDDNDSVGNNNDCDSIDDKSIIIVK